MKPVFDSFIFAFSLRVRDIDLDDVLLVLYWRQDFQAFVSIFWIIIGFAEEIQMREEAFVLWFGKVLNWLLSMSIFDNSTVCQVNFFSWMHLIHIDQFCL